MESTLRAPVERLPPITEFRYLLEKKRVKEPDAQDLYKCGAITFKEYEETLFPGKVGVSTPVY